jgi:hypothetical protein
MGIPELFGYAGSVLKARPAVGPVPVLPGFCVDLNRPVIFIKSALGSFRPGPFDAQAIACFASQLKESLR